MDNIGFLFLLISFLQKFFGTNFVFGLKFQLMSTPMGGQTKNLLHSVNQSYCVFFFLCPILCPSQLTEPGQCDSNKIDFVQILFVIIFFSWSVSITSSVYHFSPYVKVMLWLIEIRE